MKKFSKREGFTLIELLIVIVVIGILSAMMMLSSTEAVSSAKASTIVSDLRNLKTALTAWYVDNMSRIVKNKDTSKNDYCIDGITLPSDFIKAHPDEILKYLNAPGSVKLESKNSTTPGAYMIVALNLSKYWYVCYYVGDSNARIKEKLTSRAKTAGLLGAEQLGSNVTGGAADPMNGKIYNSNKFVAMLAFALE